MIPMVVNITARANDLSMLFLFLLNHESRMEQLWAIKNLLSEGNFNVISVGAFFLGKNKVARRGFILGSFKGNGHGRGKGKSNFGYGGSSTYQTCGKYRHSIFFFLSSRSNLSRSSLYLYDTSC